MYHCSVENAVPRFWGIVFYHTLWKYIVKYSDRTMKAVHFPECIGVSKAKNSLFGMLVIVESNRIKNFNTIISAAYI